MAKNNDVINKILVELDKNNVNLFDYVTIDNYFYLEKSNLLFLDLDKDLLGATILHSFQDDKTRAEQEISFFLLQLVHNTIEYLQAEINTHNDRFAFELSELSKNDKRTKTQIIMDINQFLLDKLMVVFTQAQVKDLNNIDNNKLQNAIQNVFGLYKNI